MSFLMPFKNSIALISFCFCFTACLDRGEIPTPTLEKSIAESSEVVSLSSDVIAQQLVSKPAEKVAVVAEATTDEFGDMEDPEDFPDLPDTKIDNFPNSNSIAKLKGAYGNFGGIPILWPIHAGRISSPFGMRHRKLHSGLDISAPKNTPVFAAADGQVVFAQRRRGYGNLVVIEHGENRRTAYAHLEAFKIKAGDLVNAGDLIGLVGRTGKATGFHLHFETRMEKGIPRNPLLFLPSENGRKPELSYNGEAAKTLPRLQM